MKPHQHAEQAAIILKDRAEKLGDYKPLYNNIAARVNLSLANKLSPGKSITAADITKILVEMKLARIDCGKPDKRSNPAYSEVVKRSAKFPIDELQRRVLSKLRKRYSEEAYKDLVINLEHIPIFDKLNWLREMDLKFRSEYK